jgi:hypothetical protein
MFLVELFGGVGGGVAFLENSRSVNNNDRTVFY